MKGCTSATLPPPWSPHARADGGTPGVSLLNRPPLPAETHSIMGSMRSVFTACCIPLILMFIGSGDHSKL